MIWVGWLLSLRSASILALETVVVSSSDTQTAVEVITPGDVSLPWVIWLILEELGFGEPKENHRRILHRTLLLLNSLELVAYIVRYKQIK